jgi:sterol desaturase/sphingolipid hydroxylase (fatty acid hydroxylase superfamily)
MDWATANLFLTHWLHGIQEDLGRYVIFAVSVWLILWVLLARPLSGRKIRPERPPARQMLVEFGASLRSIAIFSTVGLSTFVLYRFGLLPGPKLAASWGPAWAVVSGLAMVAGHDAWFYWTHRLIHRPKLFRAFHRRHHRSMNPSPFTAYSFDIGEAAINAAFVPLWVMIVPTPWIAVDLMLLHQIIRNTIGHSGYELFPARADGRPLLPWLTTITHHDLHHAQAGYNYGLYFTWWDKLMGTEHPQYLARFAAAVRKPAAANDAAPQASAI